MLINHSKTLKAGLDFSEKRTLCSKKHLRLKKRTTSLTVLRCSLVALGFPELKDAFWLPTTVKRLRLEFAREKNNFFNS